METEKFLEASPLSSHPELYLSSHETLTELVSWGSLVCELFLGCFFCFPFLSHVTSVFPCVCLSAFLNFPASLMRGESNGCQGPLERWFRHDSYPFLNIIVKFHLQLLYIGSMLDLNKWFLPSDRFILIHRKHNFMSFIFFLIALFIWLPWIPVWVYFRSESIILSGSIYLLLSRWW